MPRESIQVGVFGDCSVFCFTNSHAPIISNHILMKTMGFLIIFNAPVCSIFFIMFIFFSFEAREYGSCDSMKI